MNDKNLIPDILLDLFFINDITKIIISYCDFYNERLITTIYIENTNLIISVSLNHKNLYFNKINFDYINSYYIITYLDIESNKIHYEYLPRKKIRNDLIHIANTIFDLDIYDVKNIFFKNYKQNKINIGRIYNFKVYKKYIYFYNYCNFYKINLETNIRSEIKYDGNISDFFVHNNKLYIYNNTNFIIDIYDIENNILKLDKSHDLRDILFDKRNTSVGLFVTDHYIFIYKNGKVFMFRDDMVFFRKIIISKRFYNSTHIYVNENIMYLTDDEKLFVYELY